MRTPGSVSTARRDGSSGTGPGASSGLRSSAIGLLRRVFHSLLRPADLCAANAATGISDISEKRDTRDGSEDRSKTLNGRMLAWCCH